MINNETDQVDICIPTYKRPVELTALMNAVAALRIPSGVEARVLVVDNDPEASALLALAPFRNNFPLRIEYMTESAVGVSHVRNRVIECSSAKYLAMVDDDEIVTRNWLVAMFETIRATDADAVMGIVTPLLPPSVPSWLRSHLSTAVHPDDGSFLSWGSTSNALISRKRSIVETLRFNPKFNETGGEDTDFFERLLRRGGKIVFSRKAEVLEPLNASRLSLKWHLRRNFRVGQTNAHVYGRRDVIGFCQRVSRGIAGAVITILALVCIPLKEDIGIRFLLQGARNLGYFSSCFKFLIREYKAM